MDFKINFLITENKVSKAGYHKTVTINKTEKFPIVWKKSIAIYPIIPATEYAPESPKKLLFKRLNTASTNRMRIILKIKDKS